MIRLTHRTVILVCVMCQFACAVPAQRFGAVVHASAPMGVLADECEVVNSSAKAYSLFGLVSWGDASIERARIFEPSGFKLSRIATVDSSSRHVFGAGYWQTVVCGFFR